MISPGVPGRGGRVWRSSIGWASYKRKNIAENASRLVKRKNTPQRKKNKTREGKSSISQKEEETC